MKNFKEDLKPPFSIKSLFLILILLIVFIISAQRVGMPDIIERLYESSLDLVGIKDSSKIGNGLSRISREMWPPVIESKKDTNLILNFDPENIPFNSYIEKSLDKSYEINPETLLLESTEENILFLVEPFGYLKTVTIKIIESIVIALWPSFISIILSTYDLNEL